MEKIKDRSVLEDFNDLESVGALSPRNYDVLKEIFSLIEKRAIERIQETEALMEERERGLTVFYKRWNPEYTFENVVHMLWKMAPFPFVNLHFGDFYEEMEKGSLGKLKVAASDAYSVDLFDTGYNFLISESGDIYENRGWNSEGKSGNGLDICFLGSDTLQTKKITQAAGRALKDLLTFGLFKGYFVRDFTMQFVTPWN